MQDSRDASRPTPGAKKSFPPLGFPLCNLPSQYIREGRASCVGDDELGEHFFFYLQTQLKEHLCNPISNQIIRDRQAGVGVLPPSEGPEPGYFVCIRM